jgi:hypothetical protein
MSLSRLQNLYRNLRGRTIYVDQSSLDGTDSIENTGTSPLRPFITIQRALLEAVRFSYQAGRNNDRFGATTIKIAAGIYEVDNRPGYIFKEDGTFLRRSGEIVTDFTEFDVNSNFDINSVSNDLYKVNSIYSGVILPRGVSLIGDDYRKCIIKPKYVPDPQNSNLESGAIFRLTGANYITQLTFLDADPNNNAFKNYTTEVFVPNFSHHKLRAFEYVDGVNNINIKDNLVTYSTSRTDLEMYYQKVALAYGNSSGRAISPDYPNVVDIEPVSEEFNIVGALGSEVGITSIKAGDGITPTNVITVTTASNLIDVNVDSPIKISGVGVANYDGQFVVSSVLSSNQIQYRTSNPPSNPSLTPIGATVSLVIDTVNSASPYISNCALRSVYGMCGILIDGAKVDGFKSVVIERFTAVSLQKDENAFVKYDSTSGTYLFSNSVTNLQSDSRAQYNPEYSNFHCKLDNNAFAQLVSVFSIGYSEQIVTDNGGDFSITNSNSTFGSRALVAIGHKDEAFERDNQGFITHLIPPKEINSDEITIDFNAIDVAKTVSVATTNKLYLYNQTNSGLSPAGIIDGYRIGAKQNDTLKVVISENNVTREYSAKIIMPNTENTANQISSKKIFTVGRNTVGINSITSNVLTLTEPHSLLNGESVRLFSDNGHLPDGISNNKIYYCITFPTDNTLTSNQIKIAQSLNDAINNVPVTLNQKGGILSVVSRVSDKKPGEIGHPIQFDNGQWYVNVSSASTENSIYSKIVSLGVVGLGKASPKTFITRKPNNRSSEDSIYKLRYVIPKFAPKTARPPLEGYVIQETNTSIGSTDTETAKYFNPSIVTLSNSTELRKLNIIAGATWANDEANFITEIPHNLSIGSIVQISNVKSTNNTSGTLNAGYNKTLIISGISSTKHFSCELTEDPGTFTNDTSARNNSLPTFKRKTYSNTYYIQKVKEQQKYIENTQDGIYELTIVNSSNSPTVTPFNNLKFSQPIQNLYPQVDRDNLTSDPDASKCFAVPDVIGQVVVNDPQLSLTKETLEKSFLDQTVGIALTNIVSTSETSHTFYSNIDHGLSGITTVSIVNAGSGYANGNYYNTRLVGFAGSTTGSNATALVTVSAGAVTAVKIMDGGSAYGIGNTLSVTGIGTAGSGAVVRVERIANNVNDSFFVYGANNYNTLYKIDSVQVGNIKQFSATSSVAISGFSTTGVGQTFTEKAGSVLTGTTLGVSTVSYDRTTGITTVGFTTSHGLSIGSKIRLSGANYSIFNSDLIVNKVSNVTTIETNAGISTNAITGGTITAYQHGFSSYGGNTRTLPQYAGITTVLTSQLLNTDSDATPLVISNAESLGLNIGDYLLIDQEILRVNRTVSGNNVFVFRSLCGTERQTHVAGSVVRRIKVTPIEFRRTSLIKASNHSFEYVGFGPGNYSTSLPDKQDRILSAQEEILAQTTKRNGGTISFTATNGEGKTYSGNKKINTITGEETTYDVPIPTITGEDPNTNTEIVGSSIISGNEITAARSLKVNGGPDNTIISEFNGPVVFNQKITSNSKEGLEVVNLTIQGQEKVSRNFSISNAEPSVAGNYGDINFNSEPAIGENVGWVYTTNNEWEEWGWINKNLYGVGISSGPGTVGLSTLVNFVGVGITLTSTFDTTTGITTLTFTGAGAGTNKIGIYTGSSSTSSFVGNTNLLKFVGSQSGLPINLTTEFDNTTGFTTVTFQNSLEIVNFGGSLPRVGPSTSTRSAGTRIVYFDQLSSTSVDYAVGVEANASWSSVPRSINEFKWYAGTIGIATLTGTGNITLSGVTASGSVSGNTLTATTTSSQPISIASSIQVNNLNAQYLNGFPRTWYTDIPARLGYTPFNKTGDVVTGVSTFTSNVTVSGNVSVAGTITPTRIADKDGQTGTADQVLTSTGTQLDWKSIGDLSFSGRMLQFVRATQSNSVQHTTTWADTGLTATITPSSANSKIIVLINQPVAINYDSAGSIRIRRGTTVLYSPGESTYSTFADGRRSYTSSVFSLQYIDEPGSTAPVTYSTQGKVGNAAVTVPTGFYSNSGQYMTTLSPATSQIILIEIS